MSKFGQCRVLTVLARDVQPSSMLEKKGGQSERNSSLSQGYRLAEQGSALALASYLLWAAELQFEKNLPKCRSLLLLADAGAC